MENSGTLTITNSTFAGNQAIPKGNGRGGAIENNPRGKVVITNLTFSGNIAGGKGGKGGAIFNDGQFDLRGTILATSIGGNCDNGPKGKLNDGGYNLSDDASCNFSGTSQDHVRNLDLDKGLKNNGGPTQTIALTSLFSARVNRIPTDCPATDQRGYLRPAPNQANCDIGAYELNAEPPPGE